MMEITISDLLNDEAVCQHYNTAFKQQAMIGWELLFMGRWREDGDNAGQTKHIGDRA